MAAAFPQNKLSKKERNKKCHIFYNLSSDITHCHLHKIPLDTQGSPAQCRGDYQGYEKEVKIITAIFQAGSHTHSWPVHGCTPAVSCGGSRSVRGSSHRSTQSHFSSPASDPLWVLVISQFYPWPHLPSYKIHGMAGMLACGIHSRLDSTPLLGNKAYCGFHTLISLLFC